MRFQTLYLHVSPSRAFDGLAFVDRVGPGKRGE
jgi:hypothetical protein